MEDKRAQETIQKVIDRKRKTREEKIAESIGGCIGTALGLIIWYGVIGALLALGLYLLWNWIIPDVFHGPTITYWVAWGMVVFLGLIGMFFKKEK